MVDFSRTGFSLSCFDFCQPQKNQKKTGWKPGLLGIRVPFRFGIFIQRVARNPQRRKKGPKMKKRKLGKTGLEIAPLVFGGNIFGWTVDQATSFKLLDAFVAAGFNSVDTADMYSKWVPGHTGGESETIIGEWMKRSGNRNKIIVATKVGMDMGDGKKGPVEIPHSALRGRFPAAPANRLHRSVPVARRRPGHAAGRNSGRLRGTHPARQSQGHRSLQPQGGETRRGA